MTLTAAADLTMPGMAMGTVAYMSPEQAQGEDVDGRSDLFSLGIVLYEMSAGQPPFQATSPIGLLSAILRETPGLPSAFNPDVPAELDRIVKRALEKDRQLRYQTASDFRDDLRRLISQLGKRCHSSGREISAWQSAGPCRRCFFAHSSSSPGVLLSSKGSVADIG